MPDPLDVAREFGNEIAAIFADDPYRAAQTPPEPEDQEDE